MTTKKLVCCIDFSEHAEDAFNMAAEVAEKFSVPLTILHVLPPTTTPLLAESEWIMHTESRPALKEKAVKKIEDDYVSRVRDKIDTEVVVLDGHVSTEILSYLEKNSVDVVVMGSYGLTGMGLVIFGSVAKRVAHKAPCSVLIARPSKK